MEDVGELRVVRRDRLSAGTYGRGDRADTLTLTHCKVSPIWILYVLMSTGGNVFLCRKPQASWQRFVLCHKQLIALSELFEVLTRGSGQQNQTHVEKGSQQKAGGGGGNSFPGLRGMVLWIILDCSLGKNEECPKQIAHGGGTCCLVEKTSSLEEVKRWTR